MATVVNFIDTTLRGADARNVADPSHTFLLACDTPGGFKVGTNGIATPAAIKFSIVRLGLTAAASFTVSGAQLTIDGDTATLAYADMTAASATVTATITEDGATTTRPFTVSKVYDGAAGSGTTTYTWIKYADSAAGAGLSDDPTGKAYIGLAYNKADATESTNPADYAWSLIKGADGVPGAPGSSLYTWIKYSDNADGSGLYDIPTAATVYIGIAVNKTTATESTVPSDYVWSRFKGDQGVPGTGQRGPGWYYWQGNAWSDAAADAATPGDTQIGDQVTISNGTVSYTKRWDGTSWQVPGAYMDGSLFVEKSITAAKINANGLELRAPDGTLILGAGSALNPNYAAAGTKNSDLAAAISAAAINRDPNFTDPTAWEITNNRGGGAINYGNVTTATGAAGATCVYPENLVGTGNAEVWLLDVQKYPIDASRVYELSGSIYSSSGNGRAYYLAVCFYNSNGDYIDTANSGNWGGSWSGYPAHGNPAGDGQFHRYAGTFGPGTGKPIPSNATQCRVGVILNYDASGTGGGRMAAQALRLKDVTDVSKAQSTADSANNAIPGINTAIAGKLAKSGNDTINGQISLQSTYALLVGTANDGIYYGSSGIYGRKGGYTTFSISADGTATFSGSLVAATGTFGKVSVASGGGISGGDYTGFAWPPAGGKGFYIGPEGLLLGNYNDGNWFLVDNVGNIRAAGLAISNGVMTLTAPVINNPSMDAFTATLSGSAGGSYPNNTSGTTGYGTLTANPSGGKAPYSYRWSLVDAGSTGAAGPMKINATTNQSASFSGSGSNCTLDYSVACIVTDANGRTVTLGTEIFANHGTPP